MKFRTIISTLKCCRKVPFTTIELNWVLFFFVFCVKHNPYPWFHHSSTNRNIVWVLMFINFFFAPEEKVKFGNFFFFLYRKPYQCAKPNFVIWEPPEIPYWFLLWFRGKIFFHSSVIKYRNFESFAFGCMPNYINVPNYILLAPTEMSKKFRW